MSVVRYAAYGSNLHPLRLADRVRSAKLLGVSYVDGWSLNFHKRSDNDGSGKCNIIECDDAIYVAAYEIEAADKSVLDRIEGLGIGYQQATIRVPGFGECFSYLASRSHVCKKLQPYDWYKAMVVRGCGALGIPSTYASRINAIDAVRDPDARRSWEQWTIADRLRTSF